MQFVVTSDDLAPIRKLIDDLIQGSDAARIAIRRVGTKWKVVAADLSTADANLLVPLTPDD